MLLWPIHHHNHKYLYQLSSTCEQKSTVKKQHIYERKTHQPNTADFNLWCARQTRNQALHFSGKILRLSSPVTLVKNLEPSSRRLDTIGQKKILGRGGRRKLFNSSLMNKLIRMEPVSERAPFDCLLSSWMLRHPWAKNARALYFIGFKEERISFKTFFPHMSVELTYLSL